jgi:acyl-CoA reductase-like NAD-dependent aldehyde dehydrogenase
MTGFQQTISPVDGSLYLQRPFAQATDIEHALSLAITTQKSWAHASIVDRGRICEAFAAALLGKVEMLAQELSWQVGRPISQTPGEIRGCAERARAMIAAATDGLVDIRPAALAGFNRFIRRVPLGVIYVIAPWNYPYLTAINTIIPAIMAGNAVVLKHAPQTQLCAERILEAFAAAGLPEGVLQVLHLTDIHAEELVRDPRIGHVAFTGSVRTGHKVQQAAAARFVGLGLELGGKDPAYVRKDANLAFTVENLVDGAFFNSGQSCCAVERIYVDADVYDEFLERAVALAGSYRLGDPLDKMTNLGPVVRQSAADFIRAQIDEAVHAGATACVPVEHFAQAHDGGLYLAPQILTGVDHSMRLMTEETFGPVVGIMKVSSDAQAVALMNDSAYGLTAMSSKPARSSSIVATVSTLLLPGPASRTAAVAAR